jgi:hypothetical protein
MSREEFDDALAAYGANFDRWPAALAEQGKALAARDPGAAARLVEAIRLDALLAETVRPAAVDSAMMGRILAGVDNGREHETAVRPTGRLFAWAGAAMAMFLVGGFVIGLSLPSFGGDDDDAMATLMFGPGFTPTFDNGGIL